LFVELGEFGLRVDEGGCSLCVLYVMEVMGVELFVELFEVDDFSLY